jgi:methionine synthase II (cobalamin-independent)
VVDVRTLQIESAEELAERMRKVLEVVPAERVWFTTDCGLRSLPRFVAFEKLKSMKAAVETVRAEL